MAQSRRLAKRIANGYVPPGTVPDQQQAEQPADVKPAIDVEPLRARLAAKREQIKLQTQPATTLTLFFRFVWTLVQRHLKNWIAWATFVPSVILLIVSQVLAPAVAKILWGMILSIVILSLLGWAINHTARTQKLIEDEARVTALLEQRKMGAVSIDSEELVEALHKEPDLNEDQTSDAKDE